MSSDHSSKIRHWYGFFLSLLTAFMWGVLPVALELLFDVIDVVTVTWIRFLFSAVFVWLLLYHSGKLPNVKLFNTRTRILTLIAIIALVGNFLLYLVGLDLLNPETSGVIIQIAPFLLMFGSVWFYGERMAPLDLVGAAVLIAGLLLFFNEKFSVMFNDSPNYILGISSMVIAALLWSIYGLLQKTLLRQMSSVQLTFLIYSGGVVLLLFVSNPAVIFQMTLMQNLVLLFCCINMVVGYGAFSEAMHVWHAAKVSAVITLAPVITIVTMLVAVRLWPDYFTSSGLNTYSYIGAALVVAGSMLSAFSKRRVNHDD